MTMQQDSSHPTGVVDHTPKGNSEVTNARHRKALAAISMRKQHATWDEIAEVLGYPTGRAALVATENALKKELSSHESQDFMRKLAGDRLDRLARGVWKKAIDPSHPEHLVAVDRARALVGDFRKLYGLDAPTEHVITNPSVSEIESWVAKVIQVEEPTMEEADIFDAEVVEDDEDQAHAVPAG